MAAATQAVSDPLPYYRLKLDKDSPTTGGAGSGATGSGSTDTGASSGGTGGSTGSAGGSTGTGTGDSGTGSGGTPVASDQPSDPRQLQALSVNFQNYQAPVVGQDASGLANSFVQFQHGAVRFAVRGLPPGLSMAGDPGGSATLAGTPTQAGSFSGSVDVVDDWGQTGTTPFTLRVSGDPTDPATKPAFYLPALDGLYVGQAMRTQSQFLPTTTASCIRFSLKSGQLPPGMTIDPNRCSTYDTQPFTDGGNTPTLGGDFGSIVVTATPDGGTPVDSAPTPVKVGQPTLKADVTPTLVKVDPGSYDGPFNWRGKATYGSSDLSYDGVLDDSNVTLNGTPPQGMTWNPYALQFQGQPTKAGESQTMTFTVRYGGQTSTSPSFTIQVNNVLVPQVTYVACQTLPPFMGGGTSCGDRPANPAGDTLDVPYGFDPNIRITDVGGHPVTVSIAQGSVPAGMSFDPSGVIRGQSTDTGDHSLMLVMSSPGMPDATIGPLDVAVGDPSTQVNQQPNWFIPDSISLIIPYVQGTAPSCIKPFPASEGPYTNVYATGAPPHIGVQSDGTVCSVGYSSPNVTWQGEQHTSTGTVTATKGDGTTYSKSVQFQETQGPN